MTVVVEATVEEIQCNFNVSYAFLIKKFSENIFE